jgi:hypothetical protein
MLPNQVQPSRARCTLNIFRPLTVRPTPADIRKVRLGQVCSYLPSSQGIERRIWPLADGPLFKRQE